jgi:ADP-ribosylation factor-like protein 3
MLKKMKGTDTEARVLVLGLDNAGKTTILKKLSDEDPEDICPTQGFNIKSITHCGFKIAVWDIGGQKAIRQYWSQYYAGTDVLIYVVDSADSPRIEESGMELGKLLNASGLEAANLLVFANKQDLLSAEGPNEISTAMGLLDLKNRAWHIQACSAKTGEGLMEGMEKVMQWVADKRGVEAKAEDAA